MSHFWLCGNHILHHFFLNFSSSVKQNCNWKLWIHTVKEETPGIPVYGTFIKRKQWYNGTFIKRKQWYNGTTVRDPWTTPMDITTARDPWTTPMDITTVRDPWTTPMDIRNECSQEYSSEARLKRSNSFRWPHPNQSIQHTSDILGLKPPTFEMWPYWIQTLVQLWYNYKDSKQWSAPLVVVVVVVVV